MNEFVCRENKNSIFFSFSSDLVNVDKTIEAVKIFFTTKKIDCNQFEVTYIIREALNNAVIHGNNQNNKLIVECDISIINNFLKISVSDQGKGFNWQKQIEKKVVSDIATSGRGLKSMLNYGFNVHFNESGNTLYLTKKIM